MQERELKLLPGWVGVLGVLSAFGLIVLLIVVAAVTELPWLAFVVGILSVAWLFLPFGFIVNGPNQARVVQLFGNYVGTVREPGFYYGIPFYWRTRVSLRTRIFETGIDKKDEVKDATGKVIVPSSVARRPLKVNDKDGTPIDIAAVVVWKVVNPTDAIFQVDNYESFVHTQADSALRNLASQYSYDAPETDVHSLRGHITEVATQLRQELQDRMNQAGVEVQEARISYLAYAPEIAAAMLQRQQAGAIIAARARIVEGAVGMVEHALEMLKDKGVIEFDPERKAAMVSNLLVVLCGHSVPQPVLNTGTLYN
ncbi:SPFH domain-containing protein [Limnoglobus roseus]|uniref:SPFH domain-containing protein n=1 Tax=Limnoglobus roseus TaxID=2598579 RepID=A0A5C1ANT5_9BACT|nr:SPFH domain-containing protein [Limnoglobus roseus]QEL21059.1 SPFH domain-containing protein [Limnoglobus roseus]